MIVEPIIVGTIDKARIERYLFWKPYIVEWRRVLETPQIVVVLGPRHRGERKVWRRDTRWPGAPLAQDLVWLWPCNTIDTRSHARRPVQVHVI